MNFETLKTERPAFKTEAVYFADTDGSVYFVFGATEDCILAEQCRFVDSSLINGPVQRIDYARFSQWVDRGQIIQVDGQATYRVEPDTVEPKPEAEEVQAPNYPPLGSVSTGTLRNSDLVPAFLDVLDRYAPDDAREFCRDNLEGLLTAYDDGNDLPSYIAEAVSELFDLLQSISPPFCYFGASEGDGADFGYWVSLGAVDDARDAGELPSGGELPEGPTEEGLFLTISDHGNMEFYQWTGAAWVSVWGIV